MEEEYTYQLKTLKLPQHKLTKFSKILEIKLRLKESAKIIMGIASSNILLTFFKGK